MNSIEQNPLAIINLLKSNGNSKQDWGLLLSELITNNSIVNLGTITQIIKYLKENIKIDLILDVCDFILDYGSDDFISTFVIYFNEIYYLDSNKGVYLDKSIVKKKLFLIQKWANKHGRVYPKFQEKYDELKSKKIKFPSLDSKIETYLNYINEEEILKIKNICEHQNRFKELRKTCFYHEQNNEKKMENESNNPEKPKVGESKNHIQIETNIVFSNNNNKPHQNEKKNKHILKNADIKKENEEMTPNGGPNQAPISFNSGSNMDPNLGTTSYNPTPGNKDNNIIREDDNIKSSRNMNIQDNKPYRFIKTEDLNKKDIKNEDKKSENDKIFTNKGNKDNNNSQQLFNNGKQTIGNKMNFGLDELYKYNNTNVNDNISTNETNVINNNPNNNKNKNLQPNDELINNIIKNNISTTSDFTLEHNITNNIKKSIDKNSNNQNNKIINDVRNLNNNNDNYNHNYNNNINNNLSYSKGNINNPNSISLVSKNINNSNNSLNNNNNNLNYKINNKKENNIINLNNFQNNNIINNPSNNNKNNYPNYNGIIYHSSNNNINHFSNNNNINNYSNKKFIYNNSNNNINSNNLNGEIKPNKLLGSYDKYLPNYNIKNSYLRLMDLDLFKRKIEKEVKKLNSWINEGFISYHNTYTSNLKMGIENLKKELPLCDKLIEFYKGTNNLGSLNIVKNIKDSIINLFSRYEEFIKENFEIKILHRSCFNQNQNNPIYEKNRNSIL